MESWRRGRRFLAVLSIRSNGSMCHRVTAPLRYAAKASRLSTVSDSLLGLNEKDMYPPLEGLEGLREGGQVQRCKTR
jgi:hypothetical protein